MPRDRSDLLVAQALFEVHYHATHTARSQLTTQANESCDINRDILSPVVGETPFVLCGPLTSIGRIPIAARGHCDREVESSRTSATHRHLRPPFV